LKTLYASKKVMSHDILTQIKVGKWTVSKYDPSILVELTSVDALK